jgi:hypothetical protein
MRVLNEPDKVVQCGCRPDDSLSAALAGALGADQQRIAQVGLRWIELLLAKNRDYGSSVWKAPVLCPSLPVASAILSRMSDKVARIAQLTSQPASVRSETLDDTICDLGAYCLLYLARPRDNEQTQEVDDGTTVSAATD